MVDLERLNEALKAAFIKIGIYRKSDMAAYLGYKSPYFSGIINGKEKANDVFLNKISETLKVNIEWLETGRGEMLLGDVIPTYSPASSTGGDVVTMPREVFEQITKLTETVLSQQRTIETLANEIKKEAAPTGDAAKCAAVG